MEIKTENVDVTLSLTLVYREVAPGVAAFKLTENITPRHDMPAWCQKMLLKSVERQGLAPLDTVKLFEQGKVAGLVGNPQYCMVPQEYLTLVQLQGFTAVDSNTALCERIIEVNSSPLDMPDDWTVVVVDHAKHMLFDVQGVPLPVGLYFDYTHGVVCEGTYHLEKMVPYLKAHPQVHSRAIQPLDIQEVPYYNVSPGCSRFIAFVFTPTPAQMIALWEKAKELSKSFPSTALREAAFELDLLGLRAAGIARSNSYFEILEPDNTNEPGEDD